MPADRILIAGAGIGGLTAALALLRAGCPVRVLEQADELGEVGAGLTITPNGSRALASLGLGGALAEIGSAPEAGEIRHFATGATLLALPQAPAADAPLYHVHRADLHALLAGEVGRLAPDSIRTGARVAGVAQDGAHLQVTLAGGEVLEGAALVGADGVHSTVRRLCFDDGSPEFTGYVAWRGLVPGQALERGLTEPPLAIWVGPGHLFIRYRLRRGELCNYVGVAARARWAEEGWTVAAEPGELFAEFREFEPRVTRVMQATPPGTLFRWGLFARRPLASWRLGCATLLGDAAHAMPPFLGQGAVMAIEDAVVLGRAFATSGGVDEALDRYERARIGRTTRVTQDSWDCAALWFGPDPAANVRAMAATMASQRESYGYDAAGGP